MADEDRGQRPAVSRGRAQDGTSPEAIFIVGVSRSGTTLARRILDRHSLIAIATENHYLGHLLSWEGARHYFRRAGDLREDEAVRLLVDLVYSPEFQRRSRLRELSPYWRWLTSKVPPADMEARLLASDRTERGIFEAFLRIYADRRGKVIIGEKTPAHLAFVETLLAWFPDARVVHCMRDPRAIYVSELRRRTEQAVGFPYRQLVRIPALMALFVLLQVTWAWATAVHRHRELSRRFQDQYLLLRFEDLVRAPQETVAGLCRSLGVELEPRMLEQKVTSRGAMVGAMGFDAGAADRWRLHIRPGARRAIEELLGSRLAEMGYR
ncbi:MAG TPA: sulfotransferase [Candidatus Limnocylindrales bacterium]|nr:sulfotransferase [Candidatus Limnocylindrales bacterium]